MKYGVKSRVVVLAVVKRKELVDSPPTMVNLQHNIVRVK